MLGLRIAIYLAYVVVGVFVVGLILAGVWAAQQALGMAATVIITPTPGEIIVVVTRAPTVRVEEGTPVVRVLPTLTTVPTPLRTSTRVLLCLESAQAKLHVGATTCVRGQVVNMYATQTAIFVEFDAAGTGFFGTVLNPTAPMTTLVGKCIELAGTIREYEGRAYIVFQPDQAKGCATP